MREKSVNFGEARVPPAKRKNDFASKLLQASKSFLENVDYQKEIDEKYRYLLSFLHAHKRKESETFQVATTEMSFKYLETARSTNPQNTWEAQLLPTILIEIEVPKELPKRDREILEGAWYKVRSELEKVKEEEPSDLSEFFTTDKNGFINTRIILRINDEKIISYYFPPQDPQTYKLKIARKSGREKAKKAAIQEDEDKKVERTESYKPRYLSQTKIIQELTGPDEASILETAKKSYMADWLLNYVTKFYNEDERDILSDRKFKNLVIVRGVYSYFMHRKLKYSLPQIGRRVGNRDHTTILGVVRKIEAKMIDEPKFKETLEDLWEKANVDFEKYVKEENKQLNS